MDCNRLALDLLLRGDQAGLTRLATQAKRRLQNQVACPDCGDEGPHQDNGGRGAERMLCCRRCGSHFDLEG